MGESLWRQFLDEEVTDLQIALLCGGVYGLMAEFENWLQRKGLLKTEEDFAKEAVASVPSATTNTSVWPCGLGQMSFLDWAAKAFKEFSVVERSDHVIYRRYNKATRCLIPQRLDELPFKADAGGADVYVWTAREPLPF